MIKEIQTIAMEMITLNTRVYGAILSTEDIHTLENAVTTMKDVQNKINYLLHESYLISDHETTELIEILLNIHKLISQLDESIYQIYELSTKFVCNYEKEWNIVQKNVA